jgi:hypothetical protein
MNRSSARLPQNIRNALMESPAGAFGVNHVGVDEHPGSLHRLPSPFNEEECTALEGAGPPHAHFMGMVDRPFLELLCQGLPDDAQVDLTNKTRVRVASLFDVPE